MGALLSKGEAKGRVQDADWETTASTHMIMVHGALNVFPDSVCKNFVKEFCFYVHQ